MRTLLVIVLLFITSISFSQKNKFKVNTTNTILGKNLITNSDIYGIKYNFSERVHKTYLDTISDFLTVQLRGVSKNGKWLDNKGTILQYDLKNKKPLWTKKIMYQANSLQQFSNTIIFTKMNKSFCLNTFTGNELWQVKNDVYYVDPKNNIGIGYNSKNSSSYSNKLEGIDLKNGNVIWEKELNREYGWNGVYHTNDSTIIVVAAGLHAINTKNGKGWDYNTTTGKKNYTVPVGANVVGAVAGLLTGTIVTSVGHNLVRDVISNTLIDSSFIYFSSKEQLAKVGKLTGKVVWKYPFAKDLASKSSIFLNDSLVFLINRGIAYMGYRQLSFGKPFIAAFDKQTGKKKFLTLTKDKNDPILSYKIFNNDIYLVFKNHLAKYSKDTGELIKDKVYSKDSIGELRYFVGNQVFIKNKNDYFVSLNKSYKNKIFIFTSLGKILSIDNQLNIINKLDYKNLSIDYLHVKNYKFIAKNNKTLIINNRGKTVAEIKATSKAYLIKNTLYDKQNDNFIAIDLKDILKDN